MDTNNLQEVAKALVAEGKGILAADESTATIKKRFDGVGIEDTIENHAKYRELLFITPGLSEFISGVIMFEETLAQKASTGQTFPELLKEKGILSGIKVDQGLEPMMGHAEEKVTKGLEGLPERLAAYKAQGASFTKWRAVFTVGERLPSDAAIEENSNRLAEFAKASQGAGLVPIVEPEVLMEGSHSIRDSEIATNRVLKKVFEALSAHGVDFHGMLLKCNWVHHGLGTGETISQDANRLGEGGGKVDRTGEPSLEIAEATLRVLKSIVPHEVPGVVFLSGGDSPEDATEHLSAINEVGGQQPDGSLPWELSFSFGRALQTEALETWKGKDENTKNAQDIFYLRARKVAQAREGKFQ